MIGTLLLDETGDLLCGEHDGGAQTIVAGLGAEVVSQAASQAISLHKGAVWWSLQAGIDYDGLFYNAPFPHEDMELMRASELRDAVLAVPGVAGFYEDGPVTFEYEGRNVKTKMPCIEIDCDNSRVRGFVEAIT